MTTMMNSAGKKRKHADACEKTVLARVVFENTTAIEPVVIPALDVGSVKSLLVAIGNVAPFLGIGDVDLSFEPPVLRGQTLFPAVFLLQETSTGKHALQHTRWVTVHWNESLDFSRWYARNVEDGTEDELKVELHLHVEKDDKSWCDQVEALESLENDLRLAGTGETTLENRQYRHIQLEDLENPLQEWHPAFEDEDDETAGESQVAGTYEWFPMRQITNPSQGCQLCHRIAQERPKIAPRGKKAAKRQKAMARREAKEPEGSSKDDSGAGTGAGAETAVAGWTQTFVMR
ncbi:hypothetical protein EDD37DRAFT_152092 [Exophiala viscosa]|uniref:uncharacterized protein n=1 Tax=Exophiala viscosa TaxID=2486360 RepID=UPI0021997B56|nr:hypothetical protein EDD37DRAFT_152092 [Exophiala viscosa]